MNDIGNEFHEILGMLKEYINYQKVCGVDYAPVENNGYRDNSAEQYLDMDDTLARELHNIKPRLPKAREDEDMNKETKLSGLKQELEGCTRCKLADNRTTLVLGEGSLDAKLVFVGEAPGRDEDVSGRPFVGRAGKLLTKIIQAMGLRREDVYIMNIVKCRPPENRNPAEDEISQCEPFMLRQIQIIKPKIICTLGTFSSQQLLGTKTPISKLRGKFHNYHGVKLMPTFHPAFLLRNASKKREVWEDMQMIMKEYGEKGG